ncbi:telomeric repeat-binding factor 2-interacting protein 1 [Anolis carolinensis]|uniref:telomeric repeat-binding factor 2-interacting protein 1 n=1 Tax=Anolis carolinensis TaxID=28377 RepID=UPI002F2B467C
MAGPGVFLQAAQEFESSEEDEENSPRSEKVAQEQKDNEEEPPMSPSVLPGGAPLIPATSQVSLAVEDMRHLMKECGLGLESVTQALLKNSGEVGAAACCLRTGRRPDGAPLWSRQDDQDLLQGEQDLRRRLEQKFGAENVAKREAFRKS